MKRCRALAGVLGLGLLLAAKFRNIPQNWPHILLIQQLSLYPFQPGPCYLLGGKAQSVQLKFFTVFPYILSVLAFVNDTT